MVKFPKQRRNYRSVKRLRMISIETSQRLVQLLPKLCQVQTLSLDPRKLRANWQHPGDECYPPSPSISPSPSLIRLCLQWGFEDNNREAHKLHWTARVLAALFSMRLCVCTSHVFPMWPVCISCIGHPTNRRSCYSWVSEVFSSFILSLFLFFFFLYL